MIVFFNYIQFYKIHWAFNINRNFLDYRINTLFDTLLVLPCTFTIIIAGVQIQVKFIK